MRYGRRFRWGVVSVACFALLASACSSEDDPDGAIREIEPAEEEAEPEPEPEPEPDEPEPDPEPEPEPDPEPDDTENDGITRAGVFVPADAYEINEDLDLDEEQQRSLLEFTVQAYMADVEAMATLEYEEADLRRFFAEDELDLVLRTLEESAQAGELQVNEGTIIHSVALTHFEAGVASVGLCLEFGRDAGIVDTDTGEYMFRPEDEFRGLGFLLALVPVDDGQVDWRVVEGGGAGDDFRCP